MASVIRLSYASTVNYVILATCTDFQSGRSHLHLMWTVLQDSSHGSGMVCWQLGSESSHLSRVKWDEKQDMVQAPTPVITHFKYSIAANTHSVTPSSLAVQQQTVACHLTLVTKSYCC